MSSRRAKQEEDGELWVFLNFKSLLTVSLAFNQSLNHLGKVWRVLQINL